MSFTSCRCHGRVQHGVRALHDALHDLRVKHGVYDGDNTDLITVIKHAAEPYEPVQQVALKPSRKRKVEILRVAS